MRYFLFSLFVFCCLSSSPVAGGILITDFESFDFGKWKARGEAFGTGPTRDTLPGQPVVSNYSGRGYANSFHGGDASLGSLESPVFTIQEDIINFLVGGGDHPRDPGTTGGLPGGVVKGVSEEAAIQANICTVDLVVDGMVVRTATGIRKADADNEHLSWYSWDVKDLRGKTAKIIIIDNNTGPFGHITIDRIFQDDTRKMKLYENELLTRANSSMQGAIPRAAADLTRPVYHLLPPALYSNGPHGPVYHNGYYHLFYQVCPWGWGNGGRWYWGHWRSRDLVHWEQLRIMLWPSREAGEKTVMAGTSVIADDGTPMIFYSSAGPGRPSIQQWMAIGDDDLLNWKKYEQNPVLEGYGVDPWIIRENNRWYMILGCATPKRHGGFSLHRSDNLIDWEFMGYHEDIRRGEKATSWEVPNFFKLDDSWVAVFEPYGPTHYLTGTFDIESVRFEPKVHEFMDYSGISRFDFETESFIDMDSHFVGCASMEDPAGRRIHWGLVTGWDPARIGPYLMEDRGWNGCMTLPRHLKMRPDGRLSQNPIPELAQLRGEHYSVREMVLDDAAYRPNKAGGDAIEIMVEFDPGDAETFGLKVRRSDDGERFVLIQWDGQLLHLDDHAGPEGLLEGESTLRLHVFLDKCVMEVFANDWVCFTNVIYPRQEDLGIELFATGGTATVKTLDIWEMGSIW
jgi:beta-fructofuranosidase